MTYHVTKTERAGEDTGPGDVVTILGVAGSLRQGSFNQLLLRTAAGMAPSATRLVIFEDVAAIPVFNEDLEAPDLVPGAVLSLRAAMAAADGLLIATPEYNQSVPGSTKNLLDWLSRSTEGEGLNARPVAVTGATSGPWGTRISQTLLRQMLTSMQALVMPDPSLFVARVESLFDSDGRLTDQATRDALGRFLEGFHHWIRFVGHRSRVGIDSSTGAG